MSTKATIAYGKNFHFYRELGDEGSVYLELEGVQFEAAYNRVMVPIPVHIWELIRQHESVDLSLVDETDDSIRAMVEREVDERISRYQEADAKTRPMVALFGSFVYGRADAPREEQVATGVEAFLERRAWQRQVKAAIDELHKSQRDSSVADFDPE